MADTTNPKLLERLKKIQEIYNKKMDQLQDDFNKKVDQIVKEEMAKAEAKQKSEENPEAMLEDNLKSA